MSVHHEQFSCACSDLRLRKIHFDTLYMWSGLCEFLDDLQEIACLRMILHNNHRKMSPFVSRHLKIQFIITFIFQLPTNAVNAFEQYELSSKIQLTIPCYSMYKMSSQCVYEHGCSKTFYFWKLCHNIHKEIAALETSFDQNLKIYIRLWAKLILLEETYIYGSFSIGLFCKC